jgi:hypothetical protein
MNKHLLKIIREYFEIKLSFIDELLDKTQDIAWDIEYVIPHSRNNYKIQSLYGKTFRIKFTRLRTIYRYNHNCISF